MIRLSEELAAETADHGISVFAIDPGWMSTTMTAYLAASDQGRRQHPGHMPRNGSPHTLLGSGGAGTSRVRPNDEQGP